MNVFKSIKNLKNRKTSMRRKLLFYMLALAVVVLAFLSCGLFFLGHFSTAKHSAVNNLSFQMKIFERQVSKYFEDMTRMANSLSDTVAQKSEEFLSEKNATFSELDDNPSLIAELQERLFDKLGTELLKTDCSGAFVMLNATVNTGLVGSENSKTGLYFQRASLNEADETLLLYRGISEIGRANGVMPHRKWRLEFNVEEIPDYGTYLKHTASDTEKKPFLTSFSFLHGTSEKTLHFVVPVVGSNKEAFGFCGFEISANYFKKQFAQSTQLAHLTCMLFPENGNVLNPEDGFSAGIYGGYYLPPQGELTVTDLGDGLCALKGESSFVAKAQTTDICGERYVLLVAYPKEEYDKEVANNVVSVVLLLLLLVCTTFTVCVFFSRKFLKPLLKGIEQIQNMEHKDAESQFLEIEDLFAFLAEQDRQRDEEAEKLRVRCDEQGNLIEQNRTEIDRLAYSRKAEVAPDDYDVFKQGLITLTKTEKQIFALYIEGCSAEEIMTTCNIQQSTLKYHNHNIFSKLGVSSRKQMLRYAALLRQENLESLQRAKQT